MYSPSTTFLLHFRSLFTNCNEDSILHTIQMSRIFPDSKTFVDMKLLHPPAKVEENFCQLTMVAGANPDASTLREFVEDNFSLENQMEDFEPADWKSHPKLISRIQDLNYALLAQDLNSRWKTLCRKIKEEVAEQPERYMKIRLEIIFYGLMWFSGILYSTYPTLSLYQEVASEKSITGTATGSSVVSSNAKCTIQSKECCSISSI